MEAFIIYILKVAICLGVFLSIYAIFLRNTTFFKFNRFFFILGFITSLIIPTIKPTYDIIISVPVVMTAELVPEIISPATTSNISFNIWHLLIGVYLLGILLFIIRNIYSYLKIIRLVKGGTKTKGKGFILIENMSVKSAFSVLNYVLLNPTQLNEIEKDLILKHELTHINQKHWIDLLCSECMLLLQWFNPFVWIYIRVLKENHEFLADKAVIDSGISSSVYQAVLINQEFQGPVFSFSNSFNYSKPLNRLNMIKKEKSASWKRLSALAIIPMFGLLLWASAEPNYIMEYSTDLSANDTLSKLMIYQAQVSGNDSTEEEKNANTSENELTAENADTYHINIDENIVANDKDSPTTVSSTVSVSASDTIKREVSFFIKGIADGEPLLIIDGEKVSDMNNIRPEDIKSMNVLKDKSAIDIYGEDGKNGVIIITTKASDENGELKGNIKSIIVNKNNKDGEKKASFIVRGGSSISSDKQPLIVIDGEKVSSMDNIKPDDIESMNIIKDKSATDIYGEDGKNGVIQITTKKDNGKIKGKIKTITYSNSTKKNEALKGNIQTIIVNKDSIGKSSITVRGISSIPSDKQPLIVIDGEKVSSIDNIKPDDIESANIIKDKSATDLYGEDGKNGVIQITTKKNK